MYVAGLAECTWTMLCVAGVCLIAGSKAGECLVQRSRLDHSIIGEL